MIKTYIRRPVYWQKIAPFVGKDIIKVIVGQRRVGKSYFLFQIMDEIKKTNPKVNFIYLNKESEEFSAIKTGKDLLVFVAKKVSRRHKNCIFIDEIQEIDGFEKALRHLSAQGGYDIYCTGSNAHMLSSEIATGLSGRYVAVTMHSLSFPEFLIFHQLKKGEDTLFKYIRYGGLPYIINLELTDEVVYDYLKNIYNTILLKDVVARFGVRNINFLERLVVYLADNIGSFVSAKKISDFLKSQNIRISPNIVLNYLSYLVAAYFISPVKRSDINGKRIFEINEKYYFADLGLRQALIGYRQVDIGKILENLVYNHLQFLEYTITVGKSGAKEIDFICEKAGEKLYIQVAYLLPDEKVKAREFGNLLQIANNYPKLVVSLDVMAGGNYQGIHHLHLLDFLTNNHYPL
ncbi:MAG: ATP-binding protein [Candidatus Kerfeldbacteria bacterium]|nr:ATP-binding protein [Candidatus Kerfeldbacteria bacterium]